MTKLNADVIISLEKLNFMSENIEKGAKMYKYLIVKEKLFHEDIGPYKSYGIICVERESCAVVSKISDVSCDKSFVKSLAKKFTRLKLSPFHFLDAVEDALA